VNADRSRRGRPLSALKGDVPEVHRLVEWLRTLYKENDLAAGQRLWNAASAAAMRDGGTRPSPRSATPVQASEPAPLQPPAQEEPRRRRGVRRIIVGAVVLVVAAVCVILLWPGRHSRRVASPGTASPVATGTLPSRIRGDASTFVADVTYPDGSWVQVGERFTKTWGSGTSVGSGGVTDIWFARAPARARRRPAYACPTRPLAPPSATPVH
jgi:hypothetical protein